MSSCRSNDGAEDRFHMNYEQKNESPIHWSNTGRKISWSHKNLLICVMIANMSGSRPRWLQKLLNYSLTWKIDVNSQWADTDCKVHVYSDHWKHSRQISHRKKNSRDVRCVINGNISRITFKSMASVFPQQIHWRMHCCIAGMLKAVIYPIIFLIR